MGRCRGLHMEVPRGLDSRSVIVESLAVSTAAVLAFVTLTTLLVGSRLDHLRWPSSIA